MLSSCLSVFPSSCLGVGLKAPLLASCRAVSCGVVLWGIPRSLCPHVTSVHCRVCGRKGLSMGGWVTALASEVARAGGWGMDRVLPLAVPCDRVALCGCAGRLFRFTRHPGAATAVAEARVKRACGAVRCALAQQP